MTGYFDAREVLDAARGRWHQVLAGFGVRTELLTGRHGPCPGCGGNDRFRYDDRDGEGTFLCSQGGGGLLTGNGVTLLQHVTGWEWKRCIEEIGCRLLPESRRRYFGGPGTGEGAADGGRATMDDLPAEPREERPNVPTFSEDMLRSYVQGMPAITREDLKRVSPFPIRNVTCAADFLEVLYDDSERVLVFTEFYSQGDFLYQVGKGSCRLSQTKGVKAVISPMPTTAREGVWFLCNPVTGTWAPGKARHRFIYPPKGQVGPPNMMSETPWTRRDWQSLTSYRYAVLESDVASEDLWLKALVKLPLPIVAIYSSGGKSLHALVRIDAGDKLTWDLWVRGRNPGTMGRQASVMDLVCPLGADPNALTAVRLTRLPFCMREGTKPKNQGYKRYEKPRLQELVYLAPMAFSEPARWVSIEMRHGGGAR